MENKFITPFLQSQIDKALVDQESFTKEKFEQEYLCCFDPIDKSNDESIKFKAIGMLPIIFHSFVEEYIADCDYTYDFKIVSQMPLPEKTKQIETFYIDEDGYDLTTYVNQYRNGGYSGDDFAGEVYIDLLTRNEENIKQFLYFQYSM